LETSVLHTNGEKKIQKKTEYRKIRIPIGVSPSELSGLVELCQKAGYCAKTQKGVQTRKDSGKQFYNIKGLSKWLREAVIPDYKAHAWEREQRLAEAKRKREEAEAEMRRLGEKI